MWCAVHYGARHSLTNSSADYQVFHAQYSKYCADNRDFSVNKHGGVPEDAMVVVFHQLLFEKTHIKTKTTMKNVMEMVGTWAVLQCELEVSKEQCYVIQR